MDLNFPISITPDTLIPAPRYQGFVSCPTSLTAGLTPAQQAWMYRVYEIAQAQARDTLPYRQIESYREILAEIPSHWRN